MQFLSETPKTAVFKKIRSFIHDKEFTINATDDSRPWGGYFALAEEDSSLFISTFFTHLSLDDFSDFKILSPKILLVAPEKRLSWQYHLRRSEIWKVIGGKAGVIVSDTDEQTSLQRLSSGEHIEIDQGRRHRLVGLDEWGIIAEIWKHTDPENPSDEDDIIRVEDDFGR